MNICPQCFFTWAAANVCGNSLWNLEARKKSAKIADQQEHIDHSFKFRQVELQLFLICKGEVLKCFDRFRSCSNASDAWKYILITITDSYFFDSLNYLGTFFGRPYRYNGLQNALALALKFIHLYISISISIYNIYI